MKPLCNLLFTIAFATALVFANALEVTPKKVGPVSYYGALHTSGNKIVGAKNNQQAMLRGISFFWSDATGNPFYRNTVVNWAADNLHIDVFRFAMGIQYYNSQGSASEPLVTQNSYMGNPEGFLYLLDKMVAAAIENDIYIIVDWHSHRAHLETSDALTFFKTVAEKYKDVPNIIYEIYNEPVHVSWSNNIKPYANTISSAIRQYTDNLIIVGTSSWSQNPQEGARDSVSADNVAYVLHFYAASHSKGSYSGNIESALNSGHPVFISEWGTTGADGDGAPNQNATNEWTSYMDQKLIPNCNWSFRQYTSHTDGKSEQSAFFAGDTPLITEQALSEAKLTTSGEIVKKYLVQHARSWADSLTKGKRNSSCAVSHITAKETDGTISGKLQSGCDYSSSDESVAAVSGTDLIIKSYGFTVLTAKDGAQTVVYVKSIPNQTINGFMGVSCDYLGNCTTDRGSDRSMDYDEDGKKEWTYPPSNETEQGSTFTLESLDPDIVSVKKVKCKSYACSGTQSSMPAIWMYEFNSFGDARIAASAAAVSGYRELHDTIVVHYTKASNRIPGFGNEKIALGETKKEVLPDTSIFGTPITWLFDGEETSPYLQRVGIDAVAGNQKAIVKVTAKMPETDFLNAYERTFNFTIGDTSVVDTTKKQDSSGKDTSSTKTITPPVASIGNFARPQGLNAGVTGKMLYIRSNKSATIYVDIYDMLGNRVFQQLTVDAAKTPSIGLSGLPQGSYIVRVRQQSEQVTLRWVNK